MSITNTEVLINRADGSELYRRIKIRYTMHTGDEKDLTYNTLFNESWNIVDEQGAILFNSLDDKIIFDGVAVEAEFARNEILQWVAGVDAGLDPAHIDMGGWFEHSIPDYNTWEDAVSGAVTPFLQDSYMQTILKCKLTWDRLTKAEGEAIAGKNNEVSGEMAIALNIQVELDAYLPLINEDGNQRL